MKIDQEPSFLCSVMRKLSFVHIPTRYLNKHSYYNFLDPEILFGEKIRKNHFILLIFAEIKQFTESRHVKSKKTDTQLFYDKGVKNIVVDRA